jgi:hypothetical protein
MRCVYIPVSVRQECFNVRGWAMVCNLLGRSLSRRGLTVVISVCMISLGTVSDVLLVERRDFVVHGLMFVAFSALFCPVYVSVYPINCQLLYPGLPSFGLNSKSVVDATSAPCFIVRYNDLHKPLIRLPVSHLHLRMLRHVRSPIRICRNNPVLAIKLDIQQFPF